MTTPVMETSDPPARSRRPALRAGAVDAAVSAVWFAVAGAVGAVVWWQVTPLPTLTRAGDSASQASDQLVNQVGIDGWFFVVAAVGGLLSGIVLLAWRRRDPLLMVVLVALGGGLASWVMVRVGLALGPEPELTALRDLAEGDEVSMQLKLHATGMTLIWPVAAMLGALLQMWVLAKPGDENT
jgi:hypothetical protein